MFNWCEGWVPEEKKEEERNCQNWLSFEGLALKMKHDLFYIFLVYKRQRRECVRVCVYMCVHMLMEVCAWHLKQFLAKCSFVVHYPLYFLKLEVSLAVYFVFFYVLLSFLPFLLLFLIYIACRLPPTEGRESICQLPCSSRGFQRANGNPELMESMLIT